MGFSNIRDYLEILKREGELHVVDLPVDPCLELAEIQRRVVMQQGPALLFTSVKETPFPVATNLFGTRRRIELAFGEEPYRFFKRMVEAVEKLTCPPDDIAATKELADGRRLLFNLASGLYGTPRIRKSQSGHVSESAI